MIILNVSSYKTGGTWLQNILKTATENYTPLNSSNLLEKTDFINDFFDKIQASSVNADNCKKMNLAINFEPLSSELHILDKIHFYSSDFEIKNLMVKLNIKFLIMIRDYKDILISRYFHEIASDRFSEGFEKFFELKAKKILTEAYNYNEFWLNMNDFSNIQIIHYSDLKDSFENELVKIQEFLGDDVFSAKKAKEVYSIDSNKEKFSAKWMSSFEQKGGNFYRKGIVGDYKNYFSIDQEKEFETWINDLSEESYD
jgi:hypothetical protein